MIRNRLPPLASNDLLGAVANRKRQSRVTICVEVIALFVVKGILDSKEAFGRKNAQGDLMRHREKHRARFNR